MNNTLTYIPLCDVYLLDGHKIKGPTIRDQLEMAKAEYYAAWHDKESRGESLSLEEEIVSSIPSCYNASHWLVLR